MGVWVCVGVCVWGVCVRVRVRVRVRVSSALPLPYSPAPSHAPSNTLASLAADASFKAVKERNNEEYVSIVLNPQGDAVSTKEKERHVGAHRLLLVLLLTCLNRCAG